MAKFSQESRPLSVTSPLGVDKLLIEEFRGHEAVSRLFEFQLQVLAPPDAEVKFESLLGESVTVKLQLADDKFRYFNGVVRSLQEGRQVQAAQDDTLFTRYGLTVVPKLWLLTKRSQSRIFQQLSVPDILKKVLTGLDVSWEMQGTYEPRNYCVQYRESDFDFASRLMEEEGIYYYFKHADGSHKMVVADTPQSHADVPGPTTSVFRGEGDLTPYGTGDYADRIYAWEKHQEIRSGQATLWDRHFQDPDKNYEAKQTIKPTSAAGTITHKLTAGGNDKLEQYDYPGGFAQRFDGIAPGGADRAADLGKISQDNVRTVKIRMQAETTPALNIVGRSECRHFSSGHKFKLDEHFNANGDYVLTSVEHAASMRGAYTTRVTAPLEYENRFECIPLDLPYRPPRKTRRPTVEGTQTATVVGPSGQEIFTDKYGRVKVQFHWDREGTKDANSSCWLRVATTWAGTNWGAIHIPRIGQEVLVDFLEGDPDQPIVVGSVWNANQMPPYTLPDEMTKSTLKSRSTTKGDADAYNEIRFEDKKDVEEIYIHAQRDFVRVVENRDVLLVSNDKQKVEEAAATKLRDETKDGGQTIVIYNHRTETVLAGDETVTIDKGKRTITVKMGDDLHEVVEGHRTVLVGKGDDLHKVDSGDRTVIIAKGHDTHQIKTGDRKVDVAQGNDALTIKMGDRTVKLDTGSEETEAMTAITLKVGSSSIKLEQAGITIKALNIKIEGDIGLKMKAAMTDVEGAGMLGLKGGLVQIN